MSLLTIFGGYICHNVTGNPNVTLIVQLDYEEEKLKKISHPENRRISTFIREDNVIDSEPAYRRPLKIMRKLWFYGFGLI